MFVYNSSPDKHCLAFDVHCIALLEHSKNILKWGGRLDKEIIAGFTTQDHRHTNSSPQQPPYSNTNANLIQRIKGFLGVLNARYAHVAGQARVLGTGLSKGVAAAARMPTQSIW